LHCQNLYSRSEVERSRQPPRTRLLYSASRGIMASHHRALSNLVGGRSVLDGRVAGVVLVLISWRLLAEFHLQRLSISMLARLTLAHGVGSSVDTVEDDKACRISLTLSGLGPDLSHVARLLPIISRSRLLLFCDNRPVCLTYRRRRRATWA
jgi:hypothetical protein